MNFVCPKCRLPLVTLGGSARCENNHTYDKAKAGYFNLLLSNIGGTHGDNREMVEARRDFLDTGAYKPLADKVAELACRYISGSFLLDIGCGEGYYTDIIASALRERGVFVSAFDISRDAVKYAARRNGNLELAVASAYHMPTADESFDMAVNMFSPLAPEEILRTLKTDGIFIMAIPGEDHLFSLKAATYKTPYKNEVGDSRIDGFELIASERISYVLLLDSNEKIKSLFMMTPYAYRTKPEDKARVLALESLRVEAEFVVFVYKKSS
ncbi:MAG: methyltransferase domain-containing protein [Ruminococcaceae bacterium]|nr:methyltransferase domain-containing protein [Oscillospiraceae bacterium]